MRAPYGELADDSVNPASVVAPLDTHQALQEARAAALPADTRQQGNARFCVRGSLAAQHPGFVAGVLMTLVAAVVVVAAVGGVGWPGPPPLPEACVAAPASVADAVDAVGCSTLVLHGLSAQLVAATNALAAQGSSGPSSSAAPPLFADLTHATGVQLGDAAAGVPFLQTPAAAALERAIQLRRAVNDSAALMTINSVLRTLPQQLLLYKWYLMGACGIQLAARPGHSNHNSGLAVDMEEAPAWLGAMEANSWEYLGTRDPMHYNFVGAGAVDVREVSVRAFQELWNCNLDLAQACPSGSGAADAYSRRSELGALATDGAYGPATEAALMQTPVNGLGSMCVASGVSRRRQLASATTASDPECSSGCAELLIAAPAMALATAVALVFVYTRSTACFNNGVYAVLVIASCAACTAAAAVALGSAEGTCCIGDGALGTDAVDVLAVASIVLGVPLLAFLGLLVVLYCMTAHFSWRTCHPKAPGGHDSGGGDGGGGGRESLRPFALDVVGAATTRAHFGAGAGTIGMCMAPGRKKGAWRDAHDDCSRLAGHFGVTALVTLQQPRDLEWHRTVDLRRVAAGCGMDSYHFPIRDKWIPTQGLRHIRGATEDDRDSGAAAAGEGRLHPASPSFLAFIEELVIAVQRGASLAIHCNGGKGRTGTVATCMLLAASRMPGGTPLSLWAAVREVRAARPGTLYNPLQQAFCAAFIRAWPAWWHKHGNRVVPAPGPRLGEGGASAL